MLPSKLFMLCWLALIVTACAGGTNSQAIVRIGIDAALPPFEATTADPKVFAGFDIDVAQALAAQAGVKIEFVDLRIESLIPQVANCKLDGGISLIPISPNLGSQALVSNSYYSATHVVAVKKGNLLITDETKLAGMSVGVQAGSSSEDQARSLSIVPARSYLSPFLAFQDLALGAIDAVIADKPRAEYFANTKPYNVKIVGAGFGQIDYGMIFCPQRLELQTTMNAALKSIQADGTLERLKQKWNVGGK